MPSGSFGPTTAGRMDSYVDQFQAAGGSMVMIAKGNRSQQVTDACHKHGGFYLGSIGGPAAILAQDSITPRVPRTGHGSHLENRSGRLPGIHPCGQQRQRLLQAAQTPLPDLLTQNIIWLYKGSLLGIPAQETAYLHVYAHSPCECAYRRAGSVRKPQVKKP